MVSSLCGGLAAVIFASAPAMAHFQEIIPSADVLPDGGPVTLGLVFTHPFEGGPVMDMERPVKVGVLAGGKKTDLSAAITEKRVDGKEAWTLSYDVKEPGAAIFYVEPRPYWEPPENKMIVHYAKVVVDGFASGAGWDELVGLPVEIRPLTRPTGLWTGNLFSGVVLKSGEPVPFAEVEVEFVNDGGVAAPNDAFITQVIRTDANGTFSYAMPHQGWWGFAALVEGDKRGSAPDGREVPVEEGGLIWVKATDMGVKPPTGAEP
ncbi:cobalt/nickel transport protein [Kaistia soli DSM 19436]|uniref:Cobalt/nickel transport protein n=1 Tax=Kaistia soli DSM 19436 TaxID=1122133 RepID=A0A1M5I8M4_9HYPH|nr:cobalt/nickel transport protein [Kaistia soli DSM 19436]